MFATLIPAPYGYAVRVAFILIIAGLLIGFGYVRGLDHGEARLEAEHKREEAAAMAQAAHTVAAVKHQSTITAEVSDAYQTQLARLVDYYNGRLRGQPAGNGAVCAVPAVPRPAGPTHGPAPDPVPDPAAGQRVDIATLTIDCASATLQLDYLQDWIRKQEGVQ